MNYCSKVIATKLVLTIKCVYCGKLNYVSQTMSDDDTGSDIEEITCWSCGKDSLIDEFLLDVYPEYPNEAISGHFDGNQHPEL